MPRPEPDPDRIQHYNCQLPPALPSLAQSADIDPLNANKTLAWIFVTQFEIFSNNQSPGSRYEDEGI